jgi:hypothetical protein
MPCGNKMASEFSPGICRQFTVFDIQPACLGRERGVGMAKPFAVCALCIVSAALGAGIDHYFAGAIEQGGPHFKEAVSPKAAIAAPADVNPDVLGDRVRCDVRYQELKIPASEYQSFKRKCMGANWDGD